MVQRVFAVYSGDVRRIVVLRRFFCVVGLSQVESPSR